MEQASSNSNCNGGFNQVNASSDGNVNVNDSSSENCNVNNDGNSNCGDEL